MSTTSKKKLGNLLNKKYIWVLNFILTKTQKKMKAIIIGATGATGKDLVKLLSENEDYTDIELFVRRKISVESENVKTHIVDFDKPSEWQQLVNGDVAFSCMGTTLKAAGSKEAQWKVDYTYQLDFAKNAKASGVKTFVLVSSVSANSKSRFFYMRMKGELEDEIKKLNFNKFVIVRPPVLIRKGTDRMSEKIGMKGVRVFNALGLFKKMKPMSTEKVATAMINLSKVSPEGVTIVEGQQLLDFQGKMSR